MRRHNGSHRRLRTKATKSALIAVLVVGAFAGTIEQASPANATQVRAAQVQVPAPTTDRYLREEREMVVLTNRLRSRVGAPNLAVREDLEEVACEWVDTIIATGRIEHSPFIHDRVLLISRVGRDWSLAGENIGVGPTIRHIYEALVASELHYRNLVNPDFTYVGICAKRGPDGDLIVVEEFLAPRAPVDRRRNRN
jgi:uncharacterized protein YkwD